METIEVSTIAPDPSRVGGLATGKPVEGASCVLWNSKGSWPVVTPGSVTVERAYTALDVKCGKAGFAASTMALGCNQLDVKTVALLAGAFPLAMSPLGLLAFLPLDPPDAMNRPIPCWYTRGTLVVRLLPE